MSEEAKKSRKGGGKPLTSLARVTLCADLNSRAGQGCVGSPTQSLVAPGRPPPARPWRPAALLPLFKAW